MRCRLGLPVLVVTVFAGGTAAQAATIAVVNGNDSGTGSLRAAVAAANPGDTITIPSLTVSLTSGQIDITKNLTITGAGARQTTISGTGQSRVFQITGSSSSVSISGVTVTGGNGYNTPGGAVGDGGGIVVGGGTLTLADSTVTANQVAAGASGAGIATYTGSLTVLRSTISHNDASSGGGIYFYGFNGGNPDPFTFSLIDSTVADNTLSAGGRGAGVFVNYGGAGVTITNDTFDLNSAGGTGSVLDLNGETEPTSITNTIIVGAAEHSCSHMPPTSPSGGGNLEDQNLCGFAASNDHPLSTPQLGTLQDNGGPTDTQLPGTPGPAIDAGVYAACPLTDQRGVARPLSGTCDSGAVGLSAPTAGTPAVRAITATGASATATADPGFWAGTYVYRYGKTKSYGSSSVSAPLQASGGPQPAVVTLSGLAASTTYHLQLVVTTQDGTATSPDVTFTTAPFPKPALTHARLTHRRFRVSAKPTAISAAGSRTRTPLGTTFVFTLSAPAKLKITIVHVLPGLRSGRSCVKPTTGLRARHAHRCTRTVVVGTLTRANQGEGVDRFAFSGRIGHRALSPGSYEARLTASNAGGSSKPVRLGFTIVR